VLHGWTFMPDREPGDPKHSNIEAFRRLTRDIYVPAGDLGF
jgi:hypothetical protein